MYEMGPGADVVAEAVSKALGQTKTASDVRKSIRKTAGKFKDSPIAPDESTYNNPMRGFDGYAGIREGLTKATGVDFSKALNIAGLTSGTTDVSLIPIYVDPTIVDLTRRLTPMVELIPRVTNYGKTADYNQLTKRGIATAGGFYPEGAALPESNETYGRQSTSIKYLYSVGKATGQMLAASRQYLSNQYIDALNLEVRNKTVTLRYIEEDAIVNGDATTTRTAYGGGTTVSGDEFSGILKTIATISNTPIAGSGAALQIKDLRKAIRLARTANNSTTLGQGDPNLLLTDFGTLDNVKGLLQDYLRYVNTNFEIAWGLKTVEFEGLPIVPSKFMPVSTNAQKLACLSTDTWQMRVLQDVTYEEFAKTDDSLRFMLKCYEALICTAEQFNSQITNIAD